MSSGLLPATVFGYNLFLTSPCGSGGTGRRTILRGWRRKACGFESHLPHHRSPRRAMSRANEVSRGTSDFDLPSGWCCYLLLCADRSYYTGITSKLATRLRHKASGKGAGYTRNTRPIALVWYERHPDKLSAARREIQIKSWSHSKKYGLAHGDSAFQGLGACVWVSLGPPAAVSG